MRGDALQTFKNINNLNRVTLGEILIMFCRKSGKTHYMATAKYKFQQLVFNPVKPKLFGFLDELQKLAKDAFGFATEAIIEQFINAKLSLQLKKMINQVHLEYGTCEQIVSHYERELELNVLKAPDELQYKNCDATSHTTESRKNQRKPSPLQRTRSVPKPVPSTQTRLLQFLEMFE